ncbi:MAG: lytic transglycosylase domain-containing protein [Clostridia bacterium]|nr:lytic transglycosylase domain-containing protein [Clostridia bacterium]
MKFNARSALILLLILALSVGFGFAYDGIATALERNKYPLNERYADDIRAAAEAYGIPEAIVWATVCTESGFSGDLVGEDGGIGLMQLTPDTFSMIQTKLLGESAEEAGRLYEPQKNLQCGAAYLSYLYQRYGVWETVFAAYHAGTDAVDAWLQDPECVSEMGTLVKIPDAATARYVKALAEAHSLYTTLYF